MVAERGLDRLARLVQRQLKRDIAEFVRNFFGVQQPQLDSGGVHADLGGDLAKILAGGEGVFGFLRLLLGRGQDLFDLALFGHLELVLALVKRAAQRVFRDLGLRLHIVRRQARQHEAAILGSAEQIGVRIIELRELGLAGLGDAGDLGDRDADDIGDALLIAKPVKQLDHRTRRLDPAGDCLQQLVARDFLPHPRDELVLAEAVHHQHLREQASVELAVRPAERRILIDRVANDLVRHVETEAVGLLVQQAAVDQLAEDAIDDSELLHQLHVDCTAELRPHPLHRRLQRALQFDGRDLLVADRGDDDFLRAANAEQVIRNAPGPERQDQKRKQNLDDNRTRSAADCLHHVGDARLQGCGAAGRLTRADPGVIVPM